MLGPQAPQQTTIQGPQQQQGGGLLSGIVSFFQQNPELAGSLAGAAFEGVVGGDVGIGAQQGLLGASRVVEGRRKREKELFDKQVKLLQLGQKQRQKIADQALGLQAKGFEIADVADSEFLPKDAFVTLGTGNNQVKLKKPMPALSAENSAKISVLQEAKDNALEILQGIDSGKIDTVTLNRAALPGIKRLSQESQQIGARLDLMTEGLGRTLSGAAVPESEIANFRSLFAVKPTDTSSTARFKLARAIRIIENVERNAGIFLPSVGKEVKNKNNLTDYLRKETEFLKENLKGTEKKEDKGSTFQGFKLPN